MGNIVVLDENTSNKIAAGEVIERPASVVKELVENSIDAGASLISVEIKNGGISYMRITDNGCGIEEDDMELAFERHATSKIRSSNDLDSILTLGFRGEALASIAAVSSVELTSRVAKNTHGMYINIIGGCVKNVKTTGCPVGTIFIIKDMFYNTPARFKFLKKDSTEAGYISDIISRIALGNPHISLKLTSNNSTVLHTPGNNDLLSTIFSIYGKDTAKHVLPMNYSDEKLSISGYIGKPEIARASRSQQSIFINSRFIKSKVITSAIDEGFKTFLMKNKYPFIVMSLQINPALIDINVHPTKMEVRFSDEQYIFRSVYHAVLNALQGSDLKKEVHLGKEDNSETFKLNNVTIPIQDYSQQSFNIKGTGVSEIQSNTYKPQTASDHENDFLEPAHLLKTDCKLNECTDNDEQSSSIKAMPDKYNEPHDLTAAQALNIKGEVIAFSEYKIVGQAFSTYIILQHEDELILVDQHAAHERIMFERLREKRRKRENLSQVLLAPLVIELTHKEIKYLEEEKTFLNSIGFNYDNFGNNSIILRAVPVVVDNSVLKDAFLEILDHVIKSPVKDFENSVDETLYTVACKAAIKANMRLGDMEIKSLLDDLDTIENPFTCPHGRPTAIKITKQELEKKFKRIV